MPGHRSPPDVDEADKIAPRPSFAQALAVWARIGLLSFGGPAAQIALIEHEVVERRRWVEPRAFMQALNYCMLLPGPEAQQLATFLGLKLHGVRGAMAAGGLFVLPGALVLFALSWLAAAGGSWAPVQAMFHGLAPVVAALVANAVWRLGRRTLGTPLHLALAAGAFVALAWLKLDFPWVIGASAAIGALFLKGEPQAEVGPAPPPMRWGRELMRLGAYAAIFAVLWAAPVLAAIAIGGRDPFQAVAVFFTKAAFVTFGGAYAVLPYVADAATRQYGWLSQADMVHGLGLAETTPGPLILVTEFVGFFAGWNAAAGGRAGGLSPLGAGALAAALTVWVTFLPCFFYILAGAPYVERLGRLRRAAGALSAVTAAVVGVIASLGWTLLGVAVLKPGGAGPDWPAVAVLAAAFAALRLTRAGPLVLVAGGAVFGLARLALGF
ncbi:MAG: chromate efflux transporter [Proteobacteria bacterium]|nr:chromate efflux transporter [Pseudomonadota bacterium]